MVRVEGLYRALTPVSNCADPAGPVRMVHEFKLDPADYPNYTDAKRTEVVQFVDATPMSQDEFDEAWLEAIRAPQAHVPVPGCEDCFLDVLSTDEQISAPPYSVQCAWIDFIRTVQSGDATEIHSMRVAQLLCGVCGESRCGDGICDWTTEEDGSCPQDCPPDWQDH